MKTNKKFIITLLLAAVAGVCSAQNADNDAQALHKTVVDKVMAAADEWDCIVKNSDKPEVFGLIEAQLKRFEADDQQKILLQCVAPELRQNPEYIYIGNLVAAANLKQGSVAPNIEGVTPDGKTIKLSDLRGKYILLNFWTSDSEACAEEVPYLKQALKSSKGHDNFAVLSVSLDKDTAAWKKAAKSLKHANWKHMNDMKDGDSLAALMFGVKAVPHMLLLNPNGLVIEIGLHGKRMADKIGRIMDGIESYE